MALNNYDIQWDKIKTVAQLKELYKLGAREDFIADGDDPRIQEAIRLGVVSCAGPTSTKELVTKLKEAAKGSRKNAKRTVTKIEA